MGGGSALRYVSLCDFRRWRDQRISLISPTLQAECNTARAGSDKGIVLQAILNGNAANKLGGSRWADLTATDACEAMHPPKPKRENK